MRPLRIRACLLLALITFALVSTGCATGPGRDPRDPLEPMNRTIYQFNDHFDRVVLKPASILYTSITPPPVRGGVTNFFGNFHDVTTAVNNALQGKGSDALSDLGRVLINSTIGLFGIFDVATRLGLKKHNEDFGQTLGVWGTPDGAYLVLPILGPSTVRDTVGLGGDYLTDPEFYLFTDPWNYVVLGTRIVNVRANLLESEQIFNAAAVDRYAFLRDAYLQRRRNLINDGGPPPGTAPGAEPHHKTLKEMEEELDSEPPAPKKQP
jgi:phospholipid-binding lipoprotein MlaA